MTKFRTIRVATLIELLQDEAPEAFVIVAADYGDHCHTEQALPLRGEVDYVSIAESGYSSSGFAVVERPGCGDPDDDDADDVATVPGTYLVIR